MPKAKLEKWIDETLYKTYKQSFLIEKMLYDKDTKYQHISIFESKSHGKVLMLDGIEQLTEKDEYIYHEMVTHVPLCAHPNPNNVLIIGGGDGGAARRVFMHPKMHVTLVEIDKTVIEQSKKYLKKVSGNVFDEKNLTIVYDDGSHYISTTTDKFDVIITDRGDDIGPGHSLFQKKFYKNCMRCLNKDGILVTLAGVPFMQRSELAGSIKLLKSIFKINTCYLVPAPTYVGGSLAITWSSNTINPLKIAKRRLIQSYKKLKTKYFNPEIYFASFVLPNDILKVVR